MFHNTTGIALIAKTIEIIDESGITMISVLLNYSMISIGYGHCKADPIAGSGLFLERETHIVDISTILKAQPRVATVVIREECLISGLVEGMVWIERHSLVI